MIDLSKSEGKTAIPVFVDRLTKMTHLVSSTKEVIATLYARLFMDNVFLLHGMPEFIISYQDPKFVSKFWTELFSILGVGM